ncbi:hypothetical protein [Fundidesulfovibrio putealis]|uniref:hypothetical protein n=1 Tax=Fundidesulfovibrio putealis TaxID=270496 RepID=UPI00048596B8|nr:hypothetical protein [Fundidesulfovibrio putealis]
MLKKCSAIVLLVAMLSGCVATKVPKQALVLSQEDLSNKQLQTKIFDTSDEKMVLAASAGLLQDLGFNLDESCTDLGLVTSSKNRTAVDSGQVAGAIAMAILFGVVVPIDKEQKIRASLVTRPVGEKSERVAVRLTVQRVIWNDQNAVTKAETVNDPQIYQEFFNKLAQSIFLEAHDI